MAKAVAIIFSCGLLLYVGLLCALKPAKTRGQFFSFYTNEEVQGFNPPKLRYKPPAIVFRLFGLLLILLVLCFIIVLLLGESASDT